MSRLQSSSIIPGSSNGKIMKNYVEMARKSVEDRGLPYYHGLNKLHPIHYASFCRMHGRIWRDNLITDFPRTYLGFLDFVVYLGPVPLGMKKPTLGRKDHSKGYVKGNLNGKNFQKTHLKLFKEFLN